MMHTDTPPLSLDDKESKIEVVSNYIFFVPVPVLVTSMQSSCKNSCLINVWYT